MYLLSTLVKNAMVGGDGGSHSYSSITLLRKCLATCCKSDTEKNGFQSCFLIPSPYNARGFMGVLPLMHMCCVCKPTCPVAVALEI